MKKKLLITLLIGTICFCLLGCVKKENSGDFKIKNSIEDNLITSLSTTKKIIVEANNQNIQTITETIEIQKILQIIASTNHFEGFTNADSTTRILRLYDHQEALLSTIYVWDEFIGFSPRKEYVISNHEDIEALKNVWN